MHIKKNEFLIGNQLIRSRKQISHVSFSKTKPNGYSPNNKISPFKSISFTQYQQSNKQQHNQFTHSNSMISRIYQKSQYSYNETISPYNRSANTSNYSSNQTQSGKQSKSPIAQVKRNQRNVPFESLKAANIYKSSLQQINIAIKKEQIDEDQKLILNLKSLLNKEKQVILNDVDLVIKTSDQLQQKSNKIKAEIQQLQAEYDNQILFINEEQYQQTLIKYRKIMKLLEDLQIDYESVPQTFKNKEIEEIQLQSIGDENKDEMIILQQFVIKNLISEIEQQKIQNQQLIDKYKE